MRDRKLWIYPLVFLLVLVPVMVIALLIYQPGSSEAECDCAASAPAYSAHSHSMGLARTMVNDMQLIFNVSSAAELYTVEDGRLQQTGDTDGPGTVKHITLDVLDARLALGERLPVTVQLTIEDAATGETVIDDVAPPMYAPGHGYHFGDNFPLDAGTSYDWHVTVSPVEAMRLEGTQDLWLEPVEWGGSFALDEDGNVEGQMAAMQPVVDFSTQGLHIVVNALPAATEYEVQDGAAQVVDDAGSMDDARYFAVTITDHAVNYEEKLLDADVTLTFEQGDASFEAVLQPAISQMLGYHYGANIELVPGDWTVTVTVGGFAFSRHAGAAVSLPRGAVSDSFSYTVEDSGIDGMEGM